MLPLKTLQRRHGSMCVCILYMLNNVGYAQVKISQTVKMVHYSKTSNTLSWSP